MVYRKEIASENPSKPKENIYTIKFCQKFLTQLKSKILNIKIGLNFLGKKLFFFSRLKRFLYFKMRNFNL